MSAWKQQDAGGGGRDNVYSHGVLLPAHFNHRASVVQTHHTEYSSQIIEIIIISNSSVRQTDQRDPSPAT